MRSNAYVLSFMTGLTVVIGLMLSLASTALKERQDLNVEVDMKKNILRSLNIPEDRSKKLTADEVQILFEEKIEEIYIDNDGNQVTENGRPVFVKKMNGMNQGYSIPVSGKGLWSTIYGYLAVGPDGTTILGITFYKHGETPGLGGEIEKDWFTSNYKDKKIYDEEGNPVSIEIVKGQVNPQNADAFHKVDGISGATMTTKGVNQFIAQDLASYRPFFNKIRGMEY